MKNLYIDFDGVILDTLTSVYKLAKQLNLDYKTQTKEMSKLFSKIDWEELIDDSVTLNDSVNSIKKISETGKFNISILTHVNSLKEAKAKIKFLDGITEDLTIIPVPSGVSKTKMTQTKGAILIDDYSNNLIEWENAGGIGVKFTKTKEDDCKFKNITSLVEIIDMFN